MSFKKVLSIIGLSIPALSIDCYQCRESYDHNGNQQGVYNDLNCYSDNAPSEYLLPCPIGVEKCKTTITAYWLSEGPQEYLFRRDCASEEDEADVCEEDVTFANRWSKQCTSFCTTPGCNSNKDIELSFSVKENGIPVELRLYLGKNPGRNIFQSLVAIPVHPRTMKMISM